MEKPAFWRDLQLQFRALHDPRVDLYALDTDDGTWYVTARGDTTEGAIVRQFEALAARGAIAGDLTSEIEPLFGWLTALKAASPHFVPVSGTSWSRERGERSVEGGWIHQLAIASAEMCVELETRAYAIGQTDSRPPLEQLSSVPPDTPQSSVSTPEAPSEAIIQRRFARIRTYRRVNGLSAEGFARSLGMSESTVLAIINENRDRHAIDRRDQLLEYLGLSLADWYSE